MKKHYTASFKVKCVLELLREQKTLSQLASETSVHPNQLRNWRDHALREMETLFDKRDGKAELITRYESEKEDLYAQIGRLTTQLAWLKKNLVCQLTHDERTELVEWEAGELPIVTRSSRC